MLAPVSKNKSVVGSEYAPMLISMLDQAKKSVLVLMFDWRWYENDFSHPVQLINQAFVRAVRRGLDVRAITSSSAMVSKLREVGLNARVANGSGLMHSKMVLIDDEFAILGSHNLTNGALKKNFEISSIIPDLEHTLALRDHFEKLWLSLNI